MTSARRQQRANRLGGVVEVVPKAGQDEHGVPLELFDLDAAPWRSSAATGAWYQEHGIGSPSAIRGGQTPAHRLSAAITAFAVSTGRTAEPDGKSPDTRWLNAVGLARVKSQCTRLKLPAVTGRG